jgi:hypothetical protein
MSANLCAFAPLREICFKSKRRRFVGHGVGDAPNPVLDKVLAEIDKQTESFIHQTQIGQHPFTVDRLEGSDRFHFHENTIIDDQVHPKPFVEPYPIPCNWDRDLSFHNIAVFAQFMGEGNFVDDLENAWTEPAVEPVGSIDDQCCDFILFHTVSLGFPVRAAKQKITQSRQGAKGGTMSANLSAFAPLRDTSVPT